MIYTLMGMHIVCSLVYVQYLQFLILQYILVDLLIIIEHPALSNNEDLTALNTNTYILFQMTHVQFYQ